MAKCKELRMKHSEIVYMLNAIQSVSRKSTSVSCINNTVIEKMKKALRTKVGA